MEEEGCEAGREREKERERKRERYKLELSLPSISHHHSSPNSLCESLHLLREDSNLIAGDVQLLECGDGAERSGELLQLVAGEGEGDKMVEVGEIVDPTDDPNLASHCGGLV